MIDEIQHQARIGGSEVAAIFGVHDFLDEFGLWARKKGNLPRDEANDRMRLGKHLEQGIVSYYSEITGLKTIWCDETTRHPTRPFMVYTPDALVSGEPIGVDAKLIGWDQAYRWGKDSNHIPDHCVMQGWWYMSALDYDRWDVAALVMGEDRPRIYQIDRNPRAEKVMLEKAERWWERYIVGDERPPMSASDHADRWLKHTYPRHRKDSLSDANAEEAALLDEYVAVRRKFKAAEKERMTFENRIKDMIGLREGLIWPGGTFTWRLSKDSPKVDWRALGEALLETHEAAADLRREFGYVQPGSRRIHYKPADPNEEETELV